jgi:hypothetical protein
MTAAVGCRCKGTGDLPSAATGRHCAQPRWLYLEIGAFCPQTASRGAVSSGARAVSVWGRAACAVTGRLVGWPFSPED